MKTYTKNEIDLIFKNHKIWIDGNEDGERADLRGANLQDADLQDADLRRAYLQDADLRNADLRGANLRNANLRNADLQDAYLQGAYLQDAKNLSKTVTKWFQNCPEEGDFIAWKKVYSPKSRDHVVLKLLVTGKRVSPVVGRKCRTDRVTVIEAQDTNGKKVEGKNFVSGHDSDFVYTVGQEISEPNYNDDLAVECSTGIHFFITKQEAIDW